MDASEQPIAVDARMPVEAAIEQRMQSTRTLYVGSADHHVIHFVGIFTRDVRQHDPGKQRCRFGGQSLLHDLCSAFCRPEPRAARHPEQHEHDGGPVERASEITLARRDLV